MALDAERTWDATAAFAEAVVQVSLKPTTFNGWCGERGGKALMEPEPTASAAGDLQFEAAEFVSPQASARTCAVCHKEIADTYFTANGKIVCGSCRAGLAQSLTNRAGGTTRFLRACLFGLAAAVAGFLIYFAVGVLTGMELGLIAVLVGFMVGAAVRNGSRHRGGWLYQSLAIFLTYSAIASSYLGIGLKQFLDEKKAAAPAQPQAGAPALPQAGAPAQPRVRAPGKGGPVQPKAKLAGPPKQVKEPGLDPLSFVIALVVVVGFVYAMPVVGNFQSPMGLLIVGFALWEAWKFNKRPILRFEGPFQIRDEAEEEQMEGEPADA
jgi:hypothetical protein